MAYGSVVVLEDIELTGAKGEIVALTGVNGVGKSTLLSCLAGFRRQVEGTVSVLGGPPRDNAAFWRAGVIVPHQPAVLPGAARRGATRAGRDDPAAAARLVPSGRRTRRDLRPVRAGRR